MCKTASIFDRIPECDRQTGEPTESPWLRSASLMLTRVKMIRQLHKKADHIYIVRRHLTHVADTWLLCSTALDDRSWACVEDDSTQSGRRELRCEKTALAWPDNTWREARSGVAVTSFLRVNIMRRSPSPALYAFARRLTRLSSYQTRNLVHLPHLGHSWAMTACAVCCCLALQNRI